MKNKRIIIVILCVFLIVGAIIASILLNKKESLNVHEISNLQETKIGSIPDFGIIIRGDYEGMMVNSDIDYMKAYEFDAAVDNGWSIETNHYVGIRVKDAFEYLSITDYAEVEFFAKGRVAVTYKASDITDDTYFIVKRDGKLINGNVLNMISFDKDYHYSLENLGRITVTKNEG